MKIRKLVVERRQKGGEEKVSFHKISSPKKQKDFKGTRATEN